MNIIKRDGSVVEYDDKIRTAIESNAEVHKMKSVKEEIEEIINISMN